MTNCRPPIDAAMSNLVCTDTLGPIAHNGCAAGGQTHLHIPKNGMRCPKKSIFSPLGWGYRGSSAGTVSAMGRTAKKGDAHRISRVLSAPRTGPEEQLPYRPTKRCSHTARVSTNCRAIHTGTRRYWHVVPGFFVQPRPILISRIGNL